MPMIKVVTHVRVYAYNDSGAYTHLSHNYWNFDFITAVILYVIQSGQQMVV